MLDRSRRPAFTLVNARSGLWTVDPNLQGFAVTSVHKVLRVKLAAAGFASSSTAIPLDSTTCCCSSALALGLIRLVMSLMAPGTGGVVFVTNKDHVAFAMFGNYSVSGFVQRTS